MDAHTLLSGESPLLSSHSMSVAEHVSICAVLGTEGCFQAEENVFVWGCLGNFFI